MYNSFLCGTAVLFSYYFFYLVIIVPAERLLIVTKIVTTGENICVSNSLLTNRFSPLHQDQSKCNLLSVSETFRGTFHALRLSGIPFVTSISNYVKNKREASVFDASGEVFLMGL